LKSSSPQSSPSWRLLWLLPTTFVTPPSRHPPSCSFFPVTSFFPALWNWLAGTSLLEALEWGTLSSTRSSWVSVSPSEQNFTAVLPAAKSLVMEGIGTVTLHITTEHLGICKRSRLGGTFSSSRVTRSGCLSGNLSPFWPRNW
jgi:hypothetical protein